MIMSAYTSTPAQQREDSTTFMYDLNMIFGQNVLWFSIFSAKIGFRDWDFGFSMKVTPSPSQAGKVASGWSFGAMVTQAGKFKLSVPPAHDSEFIC